MSQTINVHSIASAPDGGRVEFTTPAGGACDTSLAGHYAYGTLEVYDAGWSGDEGDDLRFFLQVVNGSAGCGFEVAYHTEDGTAKSTSMDVGTPDFKAVANGTKVVMSSALTPIDIETFEDNVVEPIEKMRLVIDSITPINGTEMFGGGLTVQYPLDYSATPFNSNPGFATGFIQNDESAEVIFSIAFLDAAGLATNNAEGDAGSTKTARVTATLSKPVAGDVTVEYKEQPSWNGKPSQADGDFSMTDGTLTIPGAVWNSTTEDWEPGSAFFDVTIIGDDKVELEELIRIEFSNLDAGGLSVGYHSWQGSNGGTYVDDYVQIRIANDDHATVSFKNTTEIKEEEDGSITFTLKLDREVDVPVTVDFASVAGSAQAGVDYESAVGTHVTFAAGASGEQTLSVTIIDDEIVEAHEDFTVQIVNVLASGRAVTGTGTATGTILNEEIAVATIVDSHWFPFNWELERHTMNTPYKFHVKLSKQVDAPVTVSYQTADIPNEAEAGKDYIAKSGSVVIPAYSFGLDNAIEIMIIGDTIDEYQESFKVKLTGDDNGGGGGRKVDSLGAEAIGNIQDDD